MYDQQIRIGKYVFPVSKRWIKKYLKRLQNNDGKDQLINGFILYSYCYEFDVSS